MAGGLLADNAFDKLATDKMSVVRGGWPRSKWLARGDDFFCTTDILSVDAGAGAIAVGSPQDVAWLLACSQATHPTSSRRTRCPSYEVVGHYRTGWLVVTLSFVRRTSCPSTLEPERLRPEVRRIWRG